MSDHQSEPDEPFDTAWKEPGDESSDDPSVGSGVSLLPGWCHIRGVT